MNKKTLTAALILGTTIASLIVSAPRSSIGELATPQQTPEKPANVMKIHIKLKNKTITAMLNDTSTSRDFISLLPLTVTLRDYTATEKIADLPKKLSTDGVPEGSDPDIGDIAYYAPWENLAIFHKDFGYSKGLVILGRIDGDVDAFRAPGALESRLS